MKKSVLLILLPFSLFACKNTVKEEKWVSLFNGKNLEGWTVKICGYPAGENFGNTFYVEDSVLKTQYAAYGDTFNGRFGHLYSNAEYSHYKLRLEYRFSGSHAPGAPGWSYLNSGAMLHAQSPESVLLNQDFPVSIEAQFLGSDSKVTNTTGNVCTPGTDIYLNETPYTSHCASSTSKNYPYNEWVKAEMIVLGDSIAHHNINGDTVISYTRMTVNAGDMNPNIPSGQLKSGRIALQSEGHPVEFRNIEILDLANTYK
ncbi:MAG: DUF1080 domain-containing protein [Tannerella sp.]|jgi:hypothetical protein|nr:DUF1080 domain-containing protein [Tannerella sp.]